MTALQALRQPFVVACQPPEPSQPAKSPPNCPATWRQHESVPHRRKRHHHQCDTLLSDHRPRLVSHVRPVDPGQRHGWARLGLERYRQLPDLLLVLVPARRDMQRQQLPQRIDGEMDLAALVLPGPVQLARAPLSDVLCRVRLSRIMAVDWAVRP